MHLIHTINNPISAAIKGGYSGIQVEEKAKSLGLSDTTSNVITAVWAKRSGVLSNSLLSRVVSNNKLVDLDWSFGVTAATDDCNHIGKTFLQLKLKILKRDGEYGFAYIELSLDQFYQLLASLEKCKSYLDYFTPN